jgi:hypothetical protein
MSSPKFRKAARSGCLRSISSGRRGRAAGSIPPPAAVHAQRLAIPEFLSPRARENRCFSMCSDGRYARPGSLNAAEALTIDARAERWVVSLPDGRIAWFPASPAGARRLAVERRVVGVLAARCSFRAPEVLFVSNSGFDLRRMVPGRCDPWGLYRRCQADSGLAQKIGRSIGQILAEQHTQIVETDAAGSAARRPAPPCRPGRQ